jgi:hypothetical protein
MPLLTWPHALCNIGEQGILSDPVVVRTVVSFQRGWSRDVSGDPVPGGGADQAGRDARKQLADPR